EAARKSGLEARILIPPAGLPCSSKSHSRPPNSRISLLCGACEQSGGPPADRPHRAASRLASDSPRRRVVTHGASAQTLFSNPPMTGPYPNYFHSERGRRGLAQNRREITKLLWKMSYPRWQFDDTTFERSAAAFVNTDFPDVGPPLLSTPLRPRSRRSGRCARG